MERNKITQYDAIVYDGPLSFEDYDMIILTDQFALGKKYNSDEERAELEQIPVGKRDNLTSWMYKNGINRDNPSAVVPDEITPELVERESTNWIECIRIDIFTDSYDNVYVVGGNIVLDDDPTTDQTVAFEKTKREATNYPWVLCGTEALQHKHTTPQYTPKAIRNSIENDDVFAVDAEYVVRFDGSYGGCMMAQEDVNQLISTNKFRWMFPIR